MNTNFGQQQPSLYAISPESIQPQYISPGTIQPQYISPETIQPQQMMPPYPPYQPPFMPYPPYPPYPPMPPYPPRPPFPPTSKGGCLQKWATVRLRDGRTLYIYVTSITENSIGGFLPNGRQIALDLNEIVEMTC